MGPCWTDGRCTVSTRSIAPSPQSQCSGERDSRPQGVPFLAASRGQSSGCRHDHADLFSRWSLDMGTTTQRASGDLGCRRTSPGIQVRFMGPEAYRSFESLWDRPVFGLREKTNPMSLLVDEVDAITHAREFLAMGMLTMPALLCGIEAKSRKRLGHGSGGNEQARAAVVCC